MFATVLDTSATAVADDYEAAVDGGIETAHTARDRLLVLARAATKHALGHPERFAMVHQISGEAAHFPPVAFAAWRAAGADRVERETVAQLRALHEGGLLEIADLNRAPLHDSIEKSPARASDLARRFGEHVAGIVDAMSAAFGRTGGAARGTASAGLGIR